MFRKFSATISRPIRLKNKQKKSEAKDDDTNRTEKGKRRKQAHL